ncbi:MAG: hypothetical protein AAFN05_04425 [Pseudomonadota bacterium]
MQHFRARIAAAFAGPLARRRQTQDQALARFERAVAAVPADRQAPALRAAVRAAAASVGEAEAPSLLRCLPETVEERALAALVTRFAAGNDPGFRKLIAEADAARERSDWGRAAAAYTAALELYPLHAGYWVQLGHMRKELRQFAGAEAAYRSARTLGAEPGEVEPHLAFVCRETGAEPGDRPRATGRLPLDTPPIEPEARGLWETMLDSPCDDTAAATLMRLSPKRRLVAHLLDNPRFAPRNRGLLALIAEGGEG